MWHCIIQQPVFSCNFKFTPNNVFIFLFTNHTFLGISCSLSHNSVYISCNSGFFFSEVVLNHFYLLFLFLSQKKKSNFNILSHFFAVAWVSHISDFFFSDFRRKSQNCDTFSCNPVFISHNSGFFSLNSVLYHKSDFSSQNRKFTDLHLYISLSRNVHFFLWILFIHHNSGFFFFYTMKWNIKKSFFWIANILSQNYAFIPFYLFIFSSCGRIKLPYKSILNT